MTTELLRPSYSNISCTEDECAICGEVMSTELEVSIAKKAFFTRLQLFFSLFVREKGRLYLNTKGVLYLLSSY